MDFLVSVSALFLLVVILYSHTVDVSEKAYQKGLIEGQVRLLEGDTLVVKINQEWFIKNGN
jgi:hypothetical protein